MRKITVHLKNSNKRFFRFGGVASSESRDTYGDIILQRGIDLSLVKQGKAIVNAEHGKESIGAIEVAEIRDNHLYVEGIVYFNTIKAKQFYDLLKENDPKKPVTLSIEFVNPEHLSKDRSKLTSVVLTGVALIGLRDEPANKDTYAELLKSITREDLIEEIKRRAQDSSEFSLRLQELFTKIKRP